MESDDLHTLQSAMTSLTDLTRNAQNLRPLLLKGIVKGEQREWGGVNRVLVAVESERFRMGRNSSARHMSAHMAKSFVVAYHSHTIAY